MDRKVKGWRSSGRRRPVFSIAMAAALLAAIFLVKVQTSPWYVGMGDDSGLFAYGGQRILEGALLYRDIWDTKPPGVFYLNALALALGSVTPWAIWWFELAWISASSVVFLVVLQWLSGKAVGFVATLLFALTVLHPSYFMGGNLTEVYALLPQVLILACAAMYFSKPRAGWLLLMGAVSGGAFLLKPTYIALGLAALAVINYRRLREAGLRALWRELSLLGLGFLTPLAAVAVYWAAQGALEDLWNAVFRHNLGYVEQGFSLRGLYGTVRMFLLVPPLAPLSAIVAAAAGLFAHGLLRGVKGQKMQAPAGAAGAHVKSKQVPAPMSGPREQGELSVTPIDAMQIDARSWVFACAFLALPLEVVFVSLSGRNFGHYFITPLPAMATASAYLLRKVRLSWRTFGEDRAWYATSLVFLGLLLGSWGLEVLAKELPSLDHLADIASRPLYGSYWTDELEEYVLATSAPSDAVLVWGYNPGLHFLTGRRAPSRYLFHAQLLTAAPGGEDRFGQFIQDLHADPPALILAQEVSQHAIPFFGASEAEFCSGCSPEALQGLRALRAYVEKDYSLVDRIGDWLVYRREG